MRIVKIEPGSNLESEFIRLLEDHYVKMELVIKKDARLYEATHDEYLLSDGLYRIIGDRFEELRQKCLGSFIYIQGDDVHHAASNCYW